MGKFLHNGPCHKCGSRDNRATYDDGSEWCWGCHTFKPPDGISVENIKHSIYGKEIDLTTVTHLVPLPLDAAPILPAEPLAWLKKYELTNQEIYDNHWMWSDEQKMLIFPVFDVDGTCRFYSGRYFPTDPKKKYDIKGRKDEPQLELGNKDSDTIVVTEDVVSAIKVGRIATGMPLWGAHLSMRLALRLSKRFKRCVIWLDMDKAKESLKMARIYSPLFKQGCDCVVTDKDPKEYSTYEIKEFLNHVRVSN